MQITTTSIVFSFNDVMYRQIDGVAMGSPLWPTIANKFVGYHEVKAFSCATEPNTYLRFVDDIFASFGDVNECDDFFSVLDQLHPSLTFTVEKECNWSIQCNGSIKMPYLIIIEMIVSLRAWHIPNPSWAPPKLSQLALTSHILPNLYIAFLCSSSLSNLRSCLCVVAGLVQTNSVDKVEIFVNHAYPNAD